MAVKFSKLERQNLMRKKPLSKKPRKHRYAKRKISPELRAKKSAQLKRDRKSREPNMKVGLYMSHYVNGMRYGPGIVTLPRVLAQQFVREEQAQVEEERKLHGTRAALIGGVGPTGAHSVIEVPPETFDYSLGEYAGIGRVSGKTN